MLSRDQLAIRVPEVSPGRDSPARVLIVDDEEPIRRVIARTLDGAGHACETAASVAEAREKLSDGEFDAVVTDVRMPGASGLDLVRHVKDASPDIQVLVMTAHAEVGIAVEALRLHADDYLLKPFDLEDLLHSVERALRHRWLVLENRSYREHLEDRVLEQARRIEGLYFSSIRSLIQALEARDPHTRGHSERVTQYALLLAREVDDVNVEHLTVGAQLHDIGKIGTRETVLNKPASLKPDEVHHIREHPVIGVRILAPVIGERAILDIVRSHHERWDGSGYPDGLAGGEIPLPARIVSVADTLDAMTSSRAYRPACTWGEALEEIRRCSASQFDPDLVELMMRVLPTRPPDLSVTGEPGVGPSS